MDLDDRLRLSTEIRETVGKVKHHQLPDNVSPWIDEYDRIIGERDEFLWKWLHVLFPEITLSCVDPEYARQVRDEKLVASLFVVLLDDLAEKRQDKTTFEEASKIPFEYQSVNSGRESVDTAYLDFAVRVWNSLQKDLERGPRIAEFADLFYFELKQTINAIEYSYIVNQNLEMANTDESKRYTGHNMMLFTYANIDLIHSPRFDRDELALLRKAIGKAQRMARIGNWITTWEREIEEGDYSSGVVAYALENDIVSSDELHRLRNDRLEGGPDVIVGRIKEQGVEETLLCDWEANYAEIKELESTMDSVDMSSFLDGMETVMEYHLVSRGLK